MSETGCERLAKKGTKNSTTRKEKHSNQGLDESTYELGSSLSSAQGVDVLVVLLAVVLFSVTLLLAALFLFYRYVVRAKLEQTTPKDVSV